MEDLWLFLIGLLAGLTGSIAGIGGGFIVVPFLIFLYQMEPRQIVGTSTLVLLLSAISSTIAFTRQRRVDFVTGAWFAGAMVPGSFAGAFLTRYISGDTFYLAFGLLLLSVAGFMAIKPDRPVPFFLRANVQRTLTDATGSVFTYGYHRGFALSICFVTGFLSSLLGIGGGSIMVPTMVLLLGFPPHIATATSLFTIMVSSLAGASSHLLLGNVVWHMAMVIAVGAIAGGQVGARIAARLPGKVILRILSVTLVAVSNRLIFR